MISTTRRSRGFTLIELVTVIVILGVASAGIASFVRGSMQTYIDVSTREHCSPRVVLLLNGLNGNYAMPYLTASE